MVPVRHGEGRRAFLVGAAMFLAFAGLGIGAPGVESLFLTRFGVRYLPYMYVALGGLTVGITVLIGSAFRRLSRRSLYQGMPLVLVLWLIAARVLIGLGLHWAYPPVFLSMYVMWTLQNLLTWGTASLVFDTRQAKRLFPLFAAGGILGRALGGLSTKIWVNLIGAENLLFIWAGALLLAFLCVRVLVAAVPEAAARRSRAQHRGGAAGFWSGIRYVEGSPLLRRLALAALLVGGVYFLVVFPFSRGAVAYIPDADRLAGFLGLFQGATTGLAFLASLLLANRFYARYGLMAAIWVMAVIYLAGFAGLAGLAGLAAGGAFLVLAVFRFLQLTWLYGFTNTAFQAVFSIVPADRRDQARMTVEGVYRQAGVSLAGGVLLLAERFLELRHLALIGLALAAAAVVVVWLARKAYTGALAEALRVGRPTVFSAEEQPFGGLRQDAAAVSAVLAGVGSPVLHTRRVSAEILGHLGVPQAPDALVRALGDPDNGVRVSALRSLGQTGAAEAVLEITSLLRDPAPEVRRQAATELGRLAAYPQGLRRHLAPLLQDPEAEVRAAAASVLVRLGGDRQAFRALEEMIRSGPLEHKVLALEALGRCNGEEAYALAARCLSDPAAQVRGAALRALSRIDPSRSAGALLDALGDEDRSVVQTAAERLAEMGTGPLAVLLEALEDPAREVGALLALERQSPLRRQAEPLRAYARRKLEEMQRYRKLGAGLEGGGRTPRAHLLLAHALKAAARRQAGYALQAVGLLEGPETVRLALQNLDSPDPELRANALEMVDSLGEREIARGVIAAFETEAPRQPDPPGAADAHAQALPPLLVVLLGDPDPWVRACAAFAAGDNGLSRSNGLEVELARLAADPDLLVRDTALWARNGEKTMKTLDKLSLMERILCLQGVPLFAELPPGEIKQVAAICFEAHFADGEVIGYEGEAGDEMYVLVSGEVAVVLGEGTAERAELARRKPGEHIGEMSLLSGTARMATMVAVGEVHALGIARREFEQILRQRPETSLAVMRVLCDRLREAQSRETLAVRAARC